MSHEVFMTQKNPDPSQLALAGLRVLEIGRSEELV